MMQFVKKFAQNLIYLMLCDVDRVLMRNGILQVTVDGVAQQDNSNTRPVSLLIVSDLHIGGIPDHSETRLVIEKNGLRHLSETSKYTDDV